MTIKEARKFLDNSKIYVNGKSKEIQEKLFSLGYGWLVDQKEVINTNKPFLFINGNSQITYTDDMEYFKNQRYKEITLKELLSIEITELPYRPFKNKEECWNEMLKHQPFGYIRYKSGNNISNIITISNALIKLDNDCLDFERAFKTIEFLNDERFGIKE